MSEKEGERASKMDNVHSHVHSRCLIGTTVGDCTQQLGHLPQQKATQVSTVLLIGKMLLTS